jgi:hypothetical protein
MESMFLFYGEKHRQKIAGEVNLEKINVNTV